MVTDEERREVAKRLRDKNRERNQPGMFEPQDMGMMAYNCLLDLQSCLPGEGTFFEVLADLIEPSCDRDASGVENG